MDRLRSQRLSPSTLSTLPITSRLAEHLRLFRSYAHRPPDDFEWLLRDLEKFRAILTRWGKKPVSHCRTFEIGFGARPYRMRALQALGADVYGVDAEVPVLSGRAHEYRAMLRHNGWERVVKTVLRHALFDRRDDAAFRRVFAERGLKVRALDHRRLLIGDAANCEPPGQFDLIYSIAVFEHIERASLERLVPRMAEWLRPDGLALILPDVFTGLHGGHLLEWEADTFDLALERRSEPWEHLRKRRFIANTTLNELTRTDYRRLFEANCEILETIDPPRGRQSEFLTPGIRAELADYSDEDLLDSNPLFVLRPRSRTG